MSNYAIEVLKEEEKHLEYIREKGVGFKYEDLRDIRQAIADLEEKDMQRQMRREAEE